MEGFEDLAVVPFPQLLQQFEQVFRVLLRLNNVMKLLLFYFILIDFLLEAVLFGEDVIDDIDLRGRLVPVWNP